MEHDPDLPVGSTQKNISKSLVQMKYLHLFKCDPAIGTVLAPSAM
jgi:hypothetical protein